MIEIAKTIEIVNQDNIKKLCLITKDNEYCEVRLKDNGWLDVRLAKHEGDSMRIVMKEQIGVDLSIAEIIEYVGIRFM